MRYKVQGKLKGAHFPNGESEFFDRDLLQPIPTAVSVMERDRQNGFGRL